MIIETKGNQKEPIVQDVQTGINLLVALFPQAVGKKITLLAEYAIETFRYVIEVWKPNADLNRDAPIAVIAYWRFQEKPQIEVNDVMWYIF